MRRINFEGLKGPRRTTYEIINTQTGHADARADTEKKASRKVGEFNRNVGSSCLYAYRKIIRPYA